MRFYMAEDKYRIDPNITSKIMDSKSVNYGHAISKMFDTLGEIEVKDEERVQKAADRALTQESLKLGIDNAKKDQIIKGISVQSLYDKQNDEKAVGGYIASDYTDWGTYAKDNGIKLRSPEMMQAVEKLSDARYNKLMDENLALHEGYLKESGKFLDAKGNIDMSAVREQLKLDPTNNLGLSQAFERKYGMKIEKPAETLGAKDQAAILASQSTVAKNMAQAKKYEYEMKNGGSKSGGDNDLMAKGLQKDILNIKDGEKRAKAYEIFNDDTIPMQQKLQSIAELSEGSSFSIDKKKATQKLAESAGGLSTMADSYDYIIDNYDDGYVGVFDKNVKAGLGKYIQVPGITTPDKGQIQFQTAADTLMATGKDAFNMGASFTSGEKEVLNNIQADTSLQEDAFKERTVASLKYLTYTLENKLKAVKDTNYDTGELGKTVEKLKKARDKAIEKFGDYSIDGYIKQASSTDGVQKAPMYDPSKKQQPQAPQQQSNLQQPTNSRVNSVEDFDKLLGL